MAIWDKINKVTEKVVGSISGTQEDESTKSIHDEFNPTLGAATGKKTTFQENGLLFGSDFLSLFTVKSYSVGEQTNHTAYAGCRPSGHGKWKNTDIGFCL